MQKLVIEGGRPLRGAVSASGSKNAALPLLFASLLAPGQHRFSRVPDLADTSATLSLLGRIGCPSLITNHEVLVDTTRVAWCQVPRRVTAETRASVLLLGPLLARCGEARVPRPGGCAIGARPIEAHLQGLGALGCRIEIVGDDVRGEVTRLRGAHVALRVPTVTGTENIVMAAVLAEGTTRIENAAREPEIVELCAYLSAMGARIRGAGSPVLEIEGVRALTAPTRPWAVSPDRIETGTWLCAAAATGGDVRVDHAAPHMLGATIDALRAAGCGIDVGADWVRCHRAAPLRAIHLTTAPYPGLATDMQPLLTVVAALARGDSILEETLFEDRFRHAEALVRMGACIRREGARLRISGVETLRPATVTATDLRAGAALFVAGLAARGTTHLMQPGHLDRGYEHLLEKVAILGGRALRASEGSRPEDLVQELPKAAAG